ncbi:MAG: nucleotidyltransferase domain-containing protein [Candidatus Sabulitectum sp.]|nr:nucleotidyltransferase domain-containing protein [Candidatus Sabulitectum sp.]
MGGILPNMGRRNMPAKTCKADYPSLGIAQSLFSEVQLKVLALLFGQPNRKFQMSEIISLANSGVGAVHRIIMRLVKSGLVNEDIIGRTKFYHANTESPVFQELYGIVIKTVALTIPLQSALTPYMNSIYSAFIYGSIARGTDNASSDIDIMIIGEELRYTDILNALQPVEIDIKRTISVKILTLKEWKSKVEGQNPFVTRVLNQPKIFLKGSEYDIREP